MKIIDSIILLQVSLISISVGFTIGYSSAIQDKDSAPRAFEEVIAKADMPGIPPSIAPQKDLAQQGNDTESSVCPLQEPLAKTYDLAGLPELSKELLIKLSAKDLNKLESNLYAYALNVDKPKAQALVELAGNTVENNNPAYARSKGLAQTVLGLLHSFNPPLEDSEIGWPRGSKPYDRIMIDRGPSTKAVDQDFVASAKYFKAAIENKIEIANTYLGELYFEGKGLDQSFEMAKLYMTATADLKHKRAMINLFQLQFKQEPLSPEDLKGLMESMVGTTLSR